MAYSLKTESRNLRYDTIVNSFDISVLRYIVEEKFENRLRVTYDTPVIADGRCSVACTVKDLLTENEITRPGETRFTDKSDHPVEDAYDRAFSRAAMQILKLKVKEIDESQIVKTQPLLENDVSLIADDTLILFGVCKGHKLGEVKDTPQFLHFLDQLVEASELSFPDEARNNQVKLLQKYAVERNNNE